MVQGRYDLLCPPRSAFEIAKRWPGSRLEIVPDAGHAMTDPGIFEAMKIAIASLASLRT